MRRTSARDLLTLAKSVATSLLSLAIAIHVKMDLFMGIISTELVESNFYY